MSKANQGYMLDEGTGTRPGKGNNARWESFSVVHPERRARAVPLGRDGDRLAGRRDLGVKSVRAVTHTTRMAEWP